MKLLTLDPSSTAVGYCVATGPDHRQILDAGVLRPEKPEAPAVERILCLRRLVRELAAEHATLNRIVLEKPSGKVHGKKKHAGGAGLSTYGLAAGVIWAACMDFMGSVDDVELIDANDWTGGKSKEERAAAATAGLAGYNAEADKGLDCADAIGLSAWWFETNLIREVMSRSPEGASGGRLEKAR